jgi:hypothetical protein
MSDYLAQVLKSGRTILQDCKAPATKEKREKVAKSAATPEISAETDPHRILVKKTISDKPSKADLVKEFKRFITVEEAKL